MAPNEYQFITRWRVAGTREEVYEILSDAPDLVRWWPAVYLDVVEIEPGDETGVGKIISLYTKGWLPYTLRWQFRVTEVRRPSGFALEAWGDFVGRGVWTIAQSGEFVDITYDWRISAEKWVLKNFSFFLKPIFAANHHWAMRMGEESLQLELARRQAQTPADRSQIPPPPGPTFQIGIRRLVGPGGGRQHKGLTSDRR